MQTLDDSVPMAHSLQSGGGWAQKGQGRGREQAGGVYTAAAKDSK
jgi:hypothetical protein